MRMSKGDVVSLSVWMMILPALTVTTAFWIMKADAFDLVKVQDVKQSCIGIDLAPSVEIVGVIKICVELS